jgi:hypothetical protein
LGPRFTPDFQVTPKASLTIATEGSKAVSPWWVAANRPSSPVRSAPLQIITPQTAASDAAMAMKTFMRRVFGVAS